MNTLKAAATYFAYVFGAGFILGSIRVPFLVPRLGPRIAELIEMPVMGVVIWFAAHKVVRQFAIASETTTRLMVGFGALAMAITAELSLALLTQSVTLTEYLAGRDPVSGSVYLALLLVFAVLPAFIRSRNA